MSCAAALGGATVDEHRHGIPRNITMARRADIGRPHLGKGVCVDFVGNQDRLRLWAGQAAGVWL